MNLLLFSDSGTPVDCVSLALSGALFSWSKPLLVSIYYSFLSYKCKLNWFVFVFMMKWCDICGL